MTTILGIKANCGVEGIVLAADRQISYLEEDDTFEKKKEECKIVHGTTWLMADAGAINNQLVVFLRSGDKEMSRLLRETITKYKEHTFLYPHFEKINCINTLARRAGTELEDLTKLILAAKSSSGVQLWQVDEFGNLKKPQKENGFEYLSIGTGSERITKYIENQLEKGNIDESKMNIQKAIDLAVDAMDVAEKDPYTGGLDLAVLTGKGVDFYGATIRTAVEQAKRREINKIKRKYR